MPAHARGARSKAGIAAHPRRLRRAEGGIAASKFYEAYPPDIVNAANPLPSYEKPWYGDEPGIIAKLLYGVGDTVTRANEAMPWGGNYPQAIGIDPETGIIDPSLMIPFATNVAGMAMTGSIPSPPIAGGLGMGMRSYHGSRTGQIHPDAQDIFTSPSLTVAEHYGKSGKMFEAVPKGEVRAIDLSNPPDELIDAIMADYDRGMLPGWLDDAITNNGGRDAIPDALRADDIVQSGGPLDDTDFVNWIYEKFQPDEIKTGGGSVIYNKDAFDWIEIDSDGNPITAGRF